MAKMRDTFIVAALTNLLSLCSRISFFHWAEKVAPKGHFFVDVWVLCWLAASFVCYVVSFWVQNFYLQWAVVAISIVRMFEYLVFNLNIMLLARKREEPANLRSYRRSVILLLCNYLETIFWFATWYSILANHSLLEASESRSLSISILRESIVLMVANSTGSVTAKSDIALAAFTVHSLVGLFLTTAMVSWFISLLPRPPSADASE